MYRLYYRSYYQGLQGDTTADYSHPPYCDDEVLRPIRHDLRGGLARQNNDFPAAAAAGIVRLLSLLSVIRKPHTDIANHT